MSFKDWKEVKLSDIIQFNPRETIKKGTISKKIGMDKLDPYTRKISGYEEVPFTSGTKFRNGDTLLARITPCLENGKTAQVSILDNNEVAFGSTEFIVMREKLGETINDFIYYLAISEEFRSIAIKSMTGTSGRQRAQKDVIESSTIKLPSIEEQKSIANILSTLDDKIEVNNNINQKLEEMAQAIFKQWFIDFDFPNEEGKPYKSSGGEMVESELGMIPVTFKEVKLTDVVEIKYGKNLPKNKLEESGYPVFGGNGIIGYYKEYMYEQAQVLVSCRGAASGKVLVSDKMSYITNNSLILEIINDVTFEYLKQYCTNYPFYSYATGSAQPQITINNISNVRLYIPRDNIMNKFSNILKSIDNQVDKNRKENERLAKLRDILLPKFMSGEIRVPTNN